MTLSLARNSLRTLFLVLVALGFAEPLLGANDVAPQSLETTKLQIAVKDKASGDQVKGVAVYVKSKEEGADFQSEKKTGSDGTASVSGVPCGKILIQVTGKEWVRYGEYYDLKKEAGCAADKEIAVTIDLDRETAEEIPAEATEETPPSKQ